MHKTLLQEVIARHRYKLSFQDGRRMKTVSYVTAWLAPTGMRFLCGARAAGHQN
ncbi:MAG: hypothetical protein ACKOEW_01305 [Methylocystis sp.]